MSSKAVLELDRMRCAWPHVHPRGSTCGLRIWPCVVLVLTALALAPLAAQEQRPSRTPRIGVVLSGGGAKGLAHIGVLRVLEAAGIDAEVVTGTSMGALVGGLYAVGYTPASMDSLVTSLDWASYFLDDPQSRFLSLDRRVNGDRTIVDLKLEDWTLSLPPGVIHGQRISELLARLSWPVQTIRDFTRLPRPFVAMGTDIETGEPVVLDSGSLAAALRASMSIPGLFDPVRLDGRLVVDGGITRNLPAREARRLGADVLICSDVADPLAPAAELESLVDVLLQTMNIYIDVVSEPDRKLCDVLVRPQAPGLDAADFDDAAEWIARGDSAARVHWDRLREIAARVRVAGIRVTSPLARPVRVTRLDIVGISGDIEEYARRRLRLATPAVLGPDQLDSAVQRLYATELFNRVTYRLDVRGADTVLVMTAEPRGQDHLGIGVRYDDAYDAALLFSVQLRNRLGVGSTTQFDVRLGEQVRVAAEHLSVGIGGSRFAAGGGLSYHYTPMHLYVGGARVGGARVNVASASLVGAVLRGSEAALGVEVKAEHADVSTVVQGVETTRRQTYASGAVLARSNTLDRPHFASRGRMVMLRSEYAVGETPFAHHVGHVLLAVPVASRWSLAGRATVGTSSPAGHVPLHYTFMLGGAYPSLLFPETQVSFMGLRPQERSGTSVARLSGAVQWEPWRRVFTILRADAGHTGARVSSNPDDYTVGVGLGLGALTPAGPLEVMLSKRPSGGRALLQFSLGFPF